MFLWKKSAFFLFHIVLALFTIFGWQLPESSAQDWTTCVKPVNIPVEFDVVILNQKSEEKILRNETDDLWFQYYFAKEEDHSINMIDANDADVADLIWEVYDGNGICVAAGTSNERFGPSLATLPLGADPLGADIYIIRIIRDPEIKFIQEITYFLSVKGTGIPKVYGEIKDAFSGQKLANVRVNSRISQVDSFSRPLGFYMLHAPNGIVDLNYDLDGHKPEEINNFIINKADHFPQNAILCLEDVALKATPPSGDAPLTVTFDLPDVTNPAADFDWDFDNDMISDSADPAPTYTYSDPGTDKVNVTVSVTLPHSEFVTKEIECVVTSSVDVIVGDPSKAEIIGTWNNGIWYLDMAASNWTQMHPTPPMENT